MTYFSSYMFGRNYFGRPNGLFGATTNEQPEETSPHNAVRYQPSIEDVISVKGNLMKRTRLPLEIVDAVIDFAEYWPHTTTIWPGPQASVRAGSDHENRFMLRSYPLGFVPNWDEQSGYQITDQYQEKFQTLAPQPWAENREVPNTSTAEVLKGWAATSKPRGEFPCRRIVFTIVSNDQGWGGDESARGGYRGSFTWFDVGKEELSAFREVAFLEAWELAPWPQFRLYMDSQYPLSDAINQPPTTSNPAPLVCSLRTISPPTVVKAPSPDFDDESETQYAFSHALCPEANCLQRNVVAELSPKRHTITWSYNDNIKPTSDEASAIYLQGRGKESGTGEYARNLKMGDAVTVWAKARFPGWVNVIDEMKIDVYWAV